MEDASSRSELGEILTSEMGDILDIVSHTHVPMMILRVPSLVIVAASPGAHTRSPGPAAHRTQPEGLREEPSVRCDAAAGVRSDHRLRDPAGDQGNRPAPQPVDQRTARH